MARKKHDDASWVVVLRMVAMVGAKPGSRDGMLSSGREKRSAAAMVMWHVSSVNAGKGCTCELQLDPVE